MADVNRGNRPLSPHLQVYRLPIAAIASIMTRITADANSVTSWHIHGVAVKPFRWQN